MFSIIIVLVCGCSIFALRDFFPAGQVLVYPSLCLIPVICDTWRYSPPANVPDFRRLRMLVDTGGLYLAAIGVIFWMSFWLWLYTPEDQFMFAVQRPDLYQEFNKYTQHAGFAVFLFAMGLSMASRIVFECNVKNTLRLLSGRHTVHGQPIINFDLAGALICGLSVIGFACRAYAYSLGRVNFESDVSFEHLGVGASAFAILSSIGVLAPGAMFVLAAGARLGWIRQAAWVLLITEMTFGALLGSKGNVILPAIGCFVGYSIASRRIPRLRRFLPFGVGVLLLATVAQASRLAYREGRSISIGEFVSIWGATTFGSSTLAVDGTASFGRSYYSSRLNIAIPVMGAAAHTDKVGPSLGYESYINAALALVPSFLLPMKPLPFPNNEFGRYTGLLADGDTTTSVRPTVIGDAYYNFGLIGCYLVGGLCGMILGFVSRLAANVSSLVGSMMIYAVIYSIIDLENSFSLTFGGLIKHIFILYCILRAAQLPSAHEGVNAKRTLKTLG